MPQLGFLGAGAMGEALMRGLLAAGLYGAGDIVAFDVATDHLQGLGARLGVHAAATAAEAAAADVVLLAVKPGTVPGLLDSISPGLRPEQTLISIAAGVSIQVLEQHLPAGQPCVRVMPNTPCLVGKSATAIAVGHHAGETHRATARRIFEAVGLVVDVDEKLMDAVTGLSGSGPAFVYVFIEALSDAGVKMGLPRQLASRLAAQTVLGGAEMVLQTGQHPGQLKDMVASPAGTTIAGLHELERHGFRGTVMDAVAAATERSRALSEG